LYLASSSIGGFGDEGGLSDRIENIASFRISEPGGIAEDESVQQRLGVQVYYLEHIWERPLLGYGFGSKTKYLESGTFWLSPHSDAIAKAFDYGAIYPICLCLMVASLLWKRVRKNVEKTLKTNTVIQFAAAFLVLFLYSSSMENRVFYIVLGLIVFLEDDAKRKSDAPGGSGIVGIETNSPEAQ
jgi:O-antigen ligase